jgi:hypothetical protein
MTIEISIAGPNTQVLAAEVEAFLAEAFQETPERRSQPEGWTPHRGDPLTVAALVLAVPGAITATLDLAQRARLAERIDGLRERLRAKAAPEDTVSLLTWGETDLDLIAADRDSVLDRIEKR